MSDDVLHRFIFESASVRGEFVRLNETYQEVLSKQDYPEFVKKLLGEALCAVALLAATIKFEGRLSLQFRGKGHLKFLLAQCDSKFNLRGLAQADNELTEEGLDEAFKEGTLAILIDLGDGKSRYQGVVEWHGHSLSHSIESYFHQSEQLNTKIQFSVGEHSAAGFLLQVMPDSKKEISDEIQHDWERLSKNHTIDARDMLELSHEALLHQAYPEEDIRVFPGVDVRFYCTCSRERGEQAIYVLGREEAEAEIEDKQSLVVTCDFCNKEYVYDRIDVAKIFADRENQSPPDLH